MNDDFIAELPKAELHLHIEGTLEPEMLFALAKRNGVTIPFESVDAVREAYSFSCLQDFLDIYYQGASVLLTEQDFYDLTYAYFERCATMAVRHTEIMFDPQTHTDRGVLFETVITGITRAREDAQKKLGISSLVIMSYLRHLSEEDAFRTLEQSLPYKKHIFAIGLDSSEKGNPPSKFKRVFAASVQAGYVPVAHAGEEGDAVYVRDALDNLKVRRIDHGNATLQDTDLVQEVVDKNIALTVCPLSNIALKVVDAIANHPLRQMLDAGLQVTLNSDDPAYFGGYLDDNYRAVQDVLGITNTEIVALAKNSFAYSFLTEDEKSRHIQEINSYCVQHGVSV